MNTLYVSWQRIGLKFLNASLLFGISVRNNTFNVMVYNSVRCFAHKLKIFRKKKSERPYILLSTGCSLNIVFFLKMLWFFLTLPVLLQRWCSTCLVCVYTYWHKRKTERGQCPENFKIFGKNTISNEHPVENICLIYMFRRQFYCFV